MDTPTFIKAYAQSRNGANEFYRHNLVNSFHYSDGVRECAQAGCYWLLDIAATECPAAMRKHDQQSAMLEVHVISNRTCALALTVDDDKPAIWTKDISYTDMPVGSWVFVLADESDRVAMILISEH